MCPLLSAIIIWTVFIILSLTSPDIVLGDRFWSWWRVEIYGVLWMDLTEMNICGMAKESLWPWISSKESSTYMVSQHILATCVSHIDWQFIGSHINVCDHLRWYLLLPRYIYDRSSYMYLASNRYSLSSVGHIQAIWILAHKACKIQCTRFTMHLLQHVLMLISSWLQS